jgi:hypothetical protein
MSDTPRILYSKFEAGTTPPTIKWLISKGIIKSESQAVRIILILVILSIVISTLTIVYVMRGEPNLTTTERGMMDS